LISGAAWHFVANRIAVNNTTKKNLIHCTRKLLAIVFLLFDDCFDRYLRHVSTRKNETDWVLMIKAYTDFSGKAISFELAGTLYTEAFPDLFLTANEFQPFPKFSP
jgi:hypothetical protein